MRRLHLGVLGVLAIGLFLDGSVAARAAPSPLSEARVCARAAHRTAACSAHLLLAGGQPVRPALGRASPSATTAAVAALSPSDIASAYRLPRSGGSAVTVAIVDAFDNPAAESDLATYRAQWGLPACTTANGCFRKVNQRGAPAPPTYNSGWALEISLDLQAVSAACPDCKLLLVEGDSSSTDDLFTAVTQAVSSGGSIVNMSFAADEWSAEGSSDATFNRLGISFLAASGDSGYGLGYPAASPYVTSVGGTRLVPSSTPRGWTETVWSGTGSGCSAYEVKPRWQTDRGCPRRTGNDISAVADPATGLAVYSAANGGWIVVGGTSLSAPLIAGMQGLAGGEGNAVGAAPLYQFAATFDVTSGSNGTCGNYLCTAGPGFDGPTGLGTPQGPPPGAPPTTASWTPSAVDFGSQPTGSQTAATTATLRNTGPTDLHVSNVSFSGIDATTFTRVGDTCSGATVLAGSSCTVGVGWIPAHIGRADATLAFIDDASTPAQNIALTGIGVSAAALVLSAADVNFGPVLSGVATPIQAVTATNTGSSPLTLSSTSVSGANAADVSATLNGCTSVAAGASCSIGVRFAPGGIGAETASISIADNTPAGNHTLAVRGTGIAFTSLQGMRAYGQLSAESSATLAAPGIWSWKIARDVGLNSTGTGGYVLDGFGGLHAFGNAPAMAGPYWPNWDITRGLALRSDGRSGYVLDAFGGIHPVGGAPPVVLSAYWPNWDIARDIVLRPDGESGYVLDGFGGLHRFGTAAHWPPTLAISGYWAGWDIAHALAINSTGTGGYVLDGFGGVHGFGDAAGTAVSAYWPNWDIARDLKLLPGHANMGYTLDGFGGVHPFGGAPTVVPTLYTPGDASWRALAIA